LKQGGRNPNARGLLPFPPPRSGGLIEAL